MGYRRGGGNRLFDYSGIPQRPPLRWPNGARVAVWVIPNIEYYPIDQPGPNIFGTNRPAIDCLNAGWREYGPRVGVWRLMASMTKHGVPGTVALNGQVCEEYPGIVEEAKRLGWTFMGHGLNNSQGQRLAGLEHDDERRTIRETLRMIREHTGTTPSGWLGTGLFETWSTASILAEEGLTFVADWAADDQPFPMRVQTGRLVALPYTVELNDLPAIVQRGVSDEEFHRMCCRQFDVLYEEGAESGRVMSIAVHPFVIGQPFRLKPFEKTLEHIMSHPDVWVTTGDEIAAWYLEHYLTTANSPG